MNIKKIIKKIFNYFGLSIQKKSVLNDRDLQLISTLNYLNINLLLDIGANIGQFAEVTRQEGYKGKIVSIEPLSTAHHVLIKKAQKDSNWNVLERTAIGAMDGIIEINISENSVSSSILPILDAHTKVEKTSKYTSSEKVQLKKLDSIANSFIDKNSKLFIKIDTQGYEWDVLLGAEKTLRISRGVLLELSLVNLYQGQVLYDQILDFMKKNNFSLWAVLPNFTNQLNGQMLQIDAIFVRNNAI